MRRGHKRARESKKLMLPGRTRETLAFNIRQGIPRGESPKRAIKNASKVHRKYTRR